MRLTRSALNMLKSAYKAILLNEFIKKITVGGSEMESRAMIKDR